MDFKLTNFNISDRHFLDYYKEFLKYKHPSLCQGVVNNANCLV